MNSLNVWLRDLNWMALLAALFGLAAIAVAAFLPALIVLVLALIGAGVIAAILA